MAQRCTVTALYSYPVKGCRATALKSADVSPTGIEGDRQLVILKAAKFANQARLPKLATVATRRRGDGAIEFARTDAAPVVHAVSASGDEATIDYYGNRVGVVDQGDALAHWVSAAVDAEVRVAALKATFRRRIPLEEFAVVDGTEQSRFVDVAPILVTNEASLADLNGRLAAPVPMDRFRPNVVIAGLGAFDEDRVTALRGDDVRLVRATHCERCVVTCTDQRTGERSAEPLRTLRSYRHRDGGYAGGVMFGAYMSVLGSGTLRIGDTFEVD
jgi:hypothetical protein